MKQKRRTRKDQLRRVAEGRTLPQELADPPTKRVRRGTIFRRLKETGLDDKLIAGELTQSAAAQMLETSAAEVMRALDAVMFERATVQAAETWQRTDTVNRLLPTWAFDELEAIGLAAESPDHPDHLRFMRLLDHLVFVWEKFQHRYFRIGTEQVRMIVKPFHREWVRELILAKIFGLKVLIVAPPRHGKTEVLIGTLRWFYMMWPNRQTLWVGSATSLVKNVASSIKEHFELNEKLRTEMLPPGASFVPARHDPNKPWGANEFTINTRTAIGLKAPTMCALGITSSIPGRDVTDLMIDDIEDRDSVAEETQRQKTREKHAEVMERKEPGTFAVTICSRQHPEDIVHYLTEADDAGSWRVHVYSAHADWCDLDPDVVDGHDDNGCVLFPEVRNYEWLMATKAEYDRLGLVGRYEMRILNRPMPTTGLVFRVDEIRRNSLDPSRSLGDIRPLPPTRMIAGIDPSSKQTQAGFMWGWTPTAKYVIDIATQQAGGFEGAFRLIEDWHTTTGCDLFIYEDNSTQVEFFSDPRFFALIAKYPGLQILPHTTGKNKHDPLMGITTMAPDMHTGVVNFPYGDAESRRLVNQYLSQLASWSTDRPPKRGKTDIKMASWFPWPRMLIWDAEAAADGANSGQVVESAGNPYPMSYSGITTFTDLNEAPW